MISGLSDSSVSKANLRLKKDRNIKAGAGNIGISARTTERAAVYPEPEKNARGKSSRITMDRQTSIPSNRSKSRRRLRHACIRHVRLPDFHPQYLGIAHDTIIQKEEPENLQKSRDNANSKTTAMKKLQLKKKRSPILPIKRQRW